jgi:hypothetical protein
MMHGPEKSDLSIVAMIVLLLGCGSVIQRCIGGWAASMRQLSLLRRLRLELECRSCRDDGHVLPQRCSACRICERSDHTWRKAQKRLLLRFFGAVEAAAGQSRYVDVGTAVVGKARRHHRCCCEFNLVKQMQIHRFIQRLIPRGVTFAPLVRARHDRCRGSRIRSGNRDLLFHDNHPSPRDVAKLTLRCISLKRIGGRR